MTAEETRAILTVSLLAAFVDGDKHERERAEIKRIAEGLGRADGVNLPGLYQDVLMKRTSLADAAPALASDDARQLAYEMAVCVCDADGVQSAAEQKFLAELGRTLRLAPAASATFSD
ncbi:MAG TPA: TerB family tellurite resistance protein, partial [Burkholderiaceae bacterium]